MMYVVVGVVLAFGWIGISNKTKEQNSNYFLFFAAIVLLLFIGLRGDFTTDYRNYAKGFARYSSRSIGDIFQQKEPLFYLLIKILSIVGFQHFQVFHFAMSALVVLPAIMAIKQNSKNYLLSIFFLFVLTYYFESFNITRNCIAISFVLLGFKYLKHRNLLKWAVCVVIAVGFHMSTIILLPFYIVYGLPISWPKAGILFVVVALAALFYKPILNFFQQTLGFYDNYTKQSFGMWSRELTLGNIFNMLVRISIYVSYLGLLILNKELLDQGLYMMIISFGIFIASFRLYMLYRFDLNFFAFSLLIFPNAFAQSGFDVRIKNILMWTIVVLCIIWASFTYRGVYYPFWQNVGSY